MVVCSGNRSSFTRRCWLFSMKLLSRYTILRLLMMGRNRDIVKQNNHTPPSSNNNVIRVHSIIKEGTHPNYQERDSPYQ